MGTERLLFHCVHRRKGIKTSIIFHGTATHFRIIIQRRRCYCLAVVYFLTTAKHSSSFIKASQGIEKTNTTANQYRHANRIANK